MATVFELTDSTTMLPSYQLSDLCATTSCNSSRSEDAGGKPEVDLYDCLRHHEAQQQDGWLLSFSQGQEMAPPVFPVPKGSKMDGEKAKRKKVDYEFRIGFRTKSEVEILDDGYKWRKYGKKAVKNSPNPRNYYRCASTGCGVKKRVERDGNDSRYVITTYNGTHNHESVDVSRLPLVSTGPPLSSSCGYTMPALVPKFTWSKQFGPASYI
ncbi:hypothetical protein HPP92_004886 [Vanilla planifolia]|uniref:WRKY domain-containing protein n=1 Tax=Vanilla planifolia TaxID=51239 RepID=A0A835RYD6_VANPL|nr:hypothetical protein HPP92_004886 [Vanilla planifolia]